MEQGVLVGMYLVQSFFEMFEVLLSFFSNTLSFVRVGAFAVAATKVTFTNIDIIIFLLIYPPQARRLALSAKIRVYLVSP